MRAFSGFPEGKTGLVRLPESVFTDLLPLVDDLNELKVILHVLYRLQQGKGAMRYVSQRSLLSDPVLLRGMDGPEAVRAALARAVERGVLLQIEAEVDGHPDVVYLANSPRGRAALEALRQGVPLKEPPPP
ncbi:MAG: hypothetical protein D6793_12040, partial [Thermoflexia bacterium]